MVNIAEEWHNLVDSQVGFVSPGEEADAVIDIDSETETISDSIVRPKDPEVAAEPERKTRPVSRRPSIGNHDLIKVTALTAEAHFYRSWAERGSRSYNKTTSR